MMEEERLANAMMEEASNALSADEEEVKDDLVAVSLLSCPMGL